MLFQFSLESSLLLILFTHLLVYAILCLFRYKRDESIPDLFLGWFLLLSALFIFPWMAGFAGWYDFQPYRDILFYFPFVQGLYLGPLLYLYVKSLTNNKYVVTRSDLLQFIPGTLYLIWSVIVVIADQFLAGGYFLINGLYDPDFDSWYQFCWLISLLYYLTRSVRHYLQYSQFIQQEVSFAEAARFTWLRNFLYAFILLAGGSLLVHLISIFTVLEYKESWYYFLFFGLVFNYIAINGYTLYRVPLKRLFFDPQVLQQYAALSAPNPGAVLPVLPSSEDEKIIPESPVDPVLMEWKDKLTDLILREKIYQNPELTLTDLAKKLNSNISLLSRVINQCFNRNFNDFINFYRVEDVIEKMKDPRFARQTLLSLAFDAGFNSKATFNRAFLKFTGVQPRQYYQQLLTNNKSTSK